MKTLTTTLLIIRKNKKLLLGRKKRGFGAGKYNGVGGKLELGETVVQAMLRETKEEIGVVPKDFEEMAVVSFDEVMKGERTKVEMHIFLANDFEGEPVESDEVEPFWFDEDSIPYANMFQDDYHWLPEILAGKKVVGSFVYDDEFHLEKLELKIVKNLNLGEDYE